MLGTVGGQERAFGNPWCGRICSVTYSTYKRWILNSGISTHEVGALVRQEITPHYARLSPAVVLHLEAVDGDPSVLAIQRWPDRRTFDAAFSDPSFQTWWKEYEPILHRWDALVSFDAEWSTETII